MQTRKRKELKKTQKKVRKSNLSVCCKKIEVKLFAVQKEMSAMADGNNESSGESVSGSAGSITITAPAEHPIRINKWRVREGFPITSSQVILLYEIISGGNDAEGSSAKMLASSVVASIDKTLHKLKANRVGVVKKRSFKEGQLVPQG